MISYSTIVGTTPTLLVFAEPVTRHVLIHVIGNRIVYLGGSDVTTANGTPTEKNGLPIEVVVPANENIFGIVASSTEDVRILLPNL